MKKTLLILGIAFLSLTSCEKSPTFEECRLGTIVSERDSEWFCEIRNTCSGNIVKVEYMEGRTFSHSIIGFELELDKPW